MSYPPQGSAGTSEVAVIDANIDTLLARLTATRAVYMDALNRDRPSMIFPSAGGFGPLAVPAVAADLTFPDVVVSGLPSGITIAKADIALIIGALFDTSSSENQIAAASKTLRVKLAGDSWGTDDIIALTFVQNGLQIDADAYRGGVVLFGGIDIKSKMTADGTYNFRSEETNRSDAVVATGASLELLDVSVIIRVWFN